MPTAMPLPFEGGPFLVTQGFNTSVSHSGALRWGVDFGTPYGTPIRSVLDGDIVAFRQDATASFVGLFGKNNTHLKNTEGE